MKTAVLLRHGHAQDGVRDHDRLLTDAGRTAARATAEQLRVQGFVPDLVLTSTAARAFETAQIVAAALDCDSVIEQARALYLAEPGVYLGTLQALDARAERVLLVAHNPGLEQLAAQFGYRIRLSPADYCLVQRSVTSWAEFVP